MASSSGPLRSTHADPAEQANAENRKPTYRWLELADVAPCSVGSVWCTVWWCWLGMRRGRGPGRGQGQGGAGRGRGHGTRCAGWIAIGCVAFYGSFCSRFQSQLTLCPRPPHLTLRSPYAIAFVVSAGPGSLRSRAATAHAVRHPQPADPRSMNRRGRHTPLVLRPVSRDNALAHQESGGDLPPQQPIAGARPGLYAHRRRSLVAMNELIADGLV